MGQTHRLFATTPPPKVTASPSLHRVPVRFHMRSVTSDLYLPLILKRSRTQKLCIFPASGALLSKKTFLEKVIFEGADCLKNSVLYNGNTPSRLTTR